MGIATGKNEGNESFLRKLIHGLRKGYRIILFFFISFFLIVATIILIFLNFGTLAIICSLISLTFLLLLMMMSFQKDSIRSKEIEELQTVIEQKDKYLSDFSHRIRTPLNNFSFILEYLNDSKPEGKQKEMLETLIASTTNMIEAVNDLTVQSAQDISFEPRKSIRFGLIAALQSTIELFIANTGSKVEFDVENKDEIRDNYLGDPIAIKQIFLDLFNSIHLEDRDKINAKLEISSANAKNNKETVKIVFSADTEIPTFDSANYPNDEINSVAVKLITELKGKYSASVSPQHSELSFTLPLELAKEEERQSKAAERIKELMTESKSKKKLSDANILLVEDNPTNQKIVIITLSNLVKSIDTATTGKEALDRFGKSTYDVILMDIQLPVMDGITAAQKIRELEKSTSGHTPIIAITANAMLGDKEKCLSAGMDEYLSKPFQPTQLIQIIEKFVTA